ncbi:MAG: hypothetical protein RI947_1409 [Candidatus Parcubacteria bacterium]
MGGLIFTLVVFLVICLLLFLSSFLGSGQQSNGGHGKGGNGHGKGNGKGGQPDDPDLPGKAGAGNGKGRGGHKAAGGRGGQPPHSPHNQGGKPIGRRGQPGGSYPQGGFVPPPVLPSFNNSRDREAYCKSLESQGCRVNRSTGQVSLPGQAPESSLVGNIWGLAVCGGGIVLFIRLYGWPWIVIFEFIKALNS